MTDLAVQIEGVCKRYPHFALDNVSFDVPTGTILGFIGANGAGKSTTLRILMGLVTHDRGRVEVLGHAIPDGMIAAKAKVGYVSEEMRLFGGATLEWHMGFVAKVFGGWDTRYAAALVKRFDLRPEQKIKGLSHGQRIKAALLLALARRPRLLILDEPTTGLDPVARQEVIGALTEVMQDESRTVLFSSQNTLDVEQVADRIAFIDRGRIVDTGDKESYLDRWRRVRLALPAAVEGKTLPHAVHVTVSGRVATLVTDRHSDDLLEACRATGATVQGVDRMTLEEIFVASVMARREEVAA
ncbi:MAG: ABC transporter ATP-binding protein [Gemmatimonadales bacterium]|nr:ABC transporter ATP-binding protein [Gemmatimonadales bacterium]